VFDRRHARLGTVFVQRDAWRERTRPVGAAGLGKVSNYACIGGLGMVKASPYLVIPDFPTEKLVNEA